MVGDVTQRYSGGFMGKRYLSDSTVQREAEEIIFENLKSKLKCDDLQSNVRILISKANNIWICPDFYSEGKHIIGEIHTHLGKLKSAQLHKIEGDILKMLLFEKCHNGKRYRKMIVVCDIEEYNQLMGNSFVAEAIRQFDIELYYVSLEQTQINKIQQAMQEQNFYH